MRRSVSLIMTFLLLFCLCSIPAHAAQETETARPSVNGRLHVEGTQLMDEAGRAVQLRGVSTHGLTWFPDFVNEHLFRQVSEDWDGNLIRLALYAFSYVTGDRELCYSLMQKGIEAAIAADMYVIVDWHTLENGNPNIELDYALEFFRRITADYADCPNLIFEICNEPNEEAVWSDVLQYAQQVIPVIRENCPDAVILVGTPDYCRNLSCAVLDPLPFDNLMYVLHFYAASHHESLRDELQRAVDAELPVFISECGLSEASGDGTLDFASAAEWFTYLNEKKLSYAVWSLSNKQEASAFLKLGFDPESDIRDKDLTLSGLWVRDLLRGNDPNEIPVPAPQVQKTTADRIRAFIANSLGERGFDAVRSWPLFALIGGLLLLFSVMSGLLDMAATRKKRLTYDDIVASNGKPLPWAKHRGLSLACLLLSILCTLIYLCWRVVWSVPMGFGVIPVVGNLLLLLVEIFGFAETLILFRNLSGLRKHPLPEIPADAWPEVDIYIATYNEPVDLLRRTLNGCTYLKYPDRSKVHIWLCDDNRRTEMRTLAEEMGVGYFDRPDNEGSKAGNLNHALGLTSAPYIVTLDADMIPKSDFLLKTIPYFVDVELREQQRPEAERLHLGLLQTPQCFYQPDVFQYALYSEKRAPNEQDFFYRTIEPARTATNSVIYGGSNTVLARRALEDIGGFYTGSITEDFATGLLIESAGYVSLGLAEPLASGQTPHTYREHIQQRTRWGRGVILTAKKLKIWRRKNLRLAQKASYWSSVVYWLSPIKNLVYMISPLLFAAIAAPVFLCNWLELVVFWLPMFIFQELSLRFFSRNALSTKWSGIYETSVMPQLLIPIIKESLGISLTTFKVTDKSNSGGKRQRDTRAMTPFLILTFFSVWGILRIIHIFNFEQIISMLILLFWIIRNLYFVLMAMFLIDGRDGDSEPVRVADAEPVTVEADGLRCEGVTTLMTEHNLTVYLDDNPCLGLGTHVSASVQSDDYRADVRGVVSAIRQNSSGTVQSYTIEILEFVSDEREYLQLLYDRIPTLPQSLSRDLGLLPHLWQNIAQRVARTIK